LFEAFAKQLVNEPLSPARVRVADDRALAEQVEKPLYDERDLIEGFFNKLQHYRRALRHAQLRLRRQARLHLPTPAAL
jgi:hypothetical protein